MGCTASSNTRQNLSPQVLNKGNNSKSPSEEQNKPLHGLTPTMSSIPALKEPLENDEVNSTLKMLQNALPAVPAPPLPAVADGTIIHGNHDQEPSNMDDKIPVPPKLEGNENNAAERILFFRKLGTTPSCNILVDSSVTSVRNQQFADNGEIVLDRLWLDIQKIVSSLVSKVARFDHQDATVVFFSNSNKTTSHSGICNSEQVDALFSDEENKLKGGRDLYGPLKRIISDKSDSRPAAVIVLISDVPKDADLVTKLLLSAASSTTATRPITVTIVEVGKIAGNMKWMKSLSEEATLKSIVDVTTSASLLSYMELLS